MTMSMLMSICSCQYMPPYSFPSLSSIGQSFQNKLSSSNLNLFRNPPMPIQSNQRGLFGGLFRSKRQASISNYNVPNNCNMHDRANMNRCDLDANEEWTIQGNEDREGRQFCCAVWQSMRCKLRILWRCDNRAADMLEKETERQYKNLCYHYGRYSASCALRWWSILLIVLLGIIIIAVIGFCIFRCLRGRSKRYSY